MDIIVGEMELLRQYDDQGDVDAFLHMLAGALGHGRRGSRGEGRGGREAASTKGGGRQRSAAVGGRGRGVTVHRGLRADARHLGVAEDSEDALAVERQRFANARAYGQALIAIEGGGAVKEKLSEEAACAAALEKTARGDMSGAWVRQRSAPCHWTDVLRRSRCHAQLLQAWDAYQQVMADFLDEFEVSFMEGYEGEVEKTRGFVYEANMALDKLRKEDWMGDKSTVALFQVANGAWGRARDAFDAVHARGARRRRTSRGSCPKGGVWRRSSTPTWCPSRAGPRRSSSLRDAWVLGSSSKVCPWRGRSTWTPWRRPRRGFGWASF